MTDKPKDVFAEAAALGLKKFPPRLVTITQDKAQLERLYPKGGDGKSTIEINRRFWTTGELDSLKSLYPNTPMDDLARLLNRPVSAIYGKAKELGVKRSADFLAGEYSGRVRAGNRRGLATRFQKSHS